MTAELSQGRADTARIAQSLSAESFRQWQKAFSGVLALPAAATMSAAASVLYVTAMMERIVELFEISISDLGSNISRDMEQMRSMQSANGGGPFSRSVRMDSAEHSELGEQQQHS